MRSKFDIDTDNPPAICPASCLQRRVNVAAPASVGQQYADMSARYQREVEAARDRFAAILGVAPAAIVRDALYFLYQMTDSDETVRSAWASREWESFAARDTVQYSSRFLEQFATAAAGVPAGGRSRDVANEILPA